MFVLAIVTCVFLHLTYSVTISGLDRPVFIRKKGLQRAFGSEETKQDMAVIPPNLASYQYLLDPLMRQSWQVFGQQRT